jgi:tetratricopeptide (TPR) repeat protein
MSEITTTTQQEQTERSSARFISREQVESWKLLPLGDFVEHEDFLQFCECFQIYLQTNNKDYQEIHLDFFLENLPYAEKALRFLETIRPEDIDLGVEVTHIGELVLREIQSYAKKTKEAQDVYEKKIAIAKNIFTRKLDVLLTADKANVD